MFPIAAPSNRAMLQLQRKCDRAAAAVAGPRQAPPIVHQVLRSPGQTLDPETRAFFESRFDRDFSGVRIHADSPAAESARAVNALAYTVGRDIAFAPDKFAPATAEGRVLLAHELTHVVQQHGNLAPGPGRISAPGDSAEAEAASVERSIQAGSAPPGLYRQQASPQTPVENAQPADITVVVSWDDLLNQKLTLPSLLQPRQPRPLLPSPGTLTLGGAPQPGPLPAPSSLFNLPPPTLGSPASTPPSLGTPSPFSPTPGPSSGQPAGPAPQAPSRLSVMNSGRLSLGLRIGFPDLDASAAPGTPPSAVQNLFQQGQILNQIVTGQIPTPWQSLDKGKLASVIWSIFSTHIAPDAARNLASSLSGKPGPGGVSYELDAVLLSDFSGAGISFTLKH